jgi:DNA-binding GntR family transcriptional regulator
VTRATTSSTADRPAARMKVPGPDNGASEVVDPGGSISRFAPYLDGDRRRDRGTASVNVTDILRQAIVDGVIPERTWLREAEIAQELGVSRTPIRDAFRTLGSEGLLELNANKGAMVAPLTTDDILELYAVREVLEGLASRLAARRIVTADVATLRAILAEMRATVAERPHQELHGLGFAFHQEVRRIAANRYIDRGLAQVENTVRRFRDNTYLVQGRAEASLLEHEAIGEAIIAHDAAAAERLASEHMRRLAELRMRMMLDGY